MNARLYRLDFHSPLRIASHKFKGREQIPVPTLGGILDSIALHMRAKQPRLAEQLGIDKTWKASSVAEQTQALCCADKLASQPECAFPSSKARPERREESRKNHPQSIRGIIDSFIFPATCGKQEQMLLYWGQWTGVGQKTTAGFGNYTLSFI